MIYLSFPAACFPCVLYKQLKHTPKPPKHFPRIFALKNMSEQSLLLSNLLKLVLVQVLLKYIADETFSSALYD